MPRRHSGSVRTACCHRHCRTGRAGIVCHRVRRRVVGLGEAFSSTNTTVSLSGIELVLWTALPPSSTLTSMPIAARSFPRRCLRWPQARPLSCHEVTQCARYSLSRYWQLDSSTFACDNPPATPPQASATAVPTTAAAAVPQSLVAPVPEPSGPIDFKSVTDLKQAPPPGEPELPRRPGGHLQGLAGVPLHDVQDCSRHWPLAPPPSSGPKEC